MTSSGRPSAMMRPASMQTSRSATCTRIWTICSIQTILSLRARGIGIVWIEHIVHILVQVAERLVCMDAGRIIAEGRPDEVMAHAEVVKAYIGGAPA
jgi:ABC-type lipopolysaccharide export system ATPase subunit